MDQNPHQLPERILKRLARGRTLDLFGPAETALQKEILYTANEEVMNDETDDSMSVKSTDSEEEESRDNFTMKMESLSESGLQWITVEPEPDLWNTSFEAFKVEEAQT